MQTQIIDFPTQAFINGNWIDADSAKTFAVDNPSTGNLLAQVADCGAVETTAAITRAVGL